MRTIACVLVLGIVAGGSWGWLYWGWRREHAALAVLKPNLLNESPLGGYGWRSSLGPAGFALDRVDFMFVRPITDAEMPLVGRFGQLSLLDLSGQGISDAGLSSVENLGLLENLDLGGTSVTDVGLTHLRKLSLLSELSLGRTRITDAGVGTLSRMAKLRVLRIGGSAITDKGLEPLKGLPGLQVLEIGASAITDKGLKSLKELHGLRELNVMGTQITDEGLAALGDARGLVVLHLSCNHIRGPGLAHLEKLAGLRELNLSDTDIHDAELANVGRLQGLRRLDLHGLLLTDRGLAHLKGLAKLEELDLRGASITDVGLEQLRALTQLRILLVSTWGEKDGTSREVVTAAAIRKLQQALPGLTVDGDNSEGLWNRRVEDDEERELAIRREGERLDGEWPKIIELQHRPPVKAKCRLDELWPGPRRRYFVFDLNSDGSPEYFIENWSGAHRVGFAVTDERGQPLMTQKEIVEFGGDSVVILKSRHHGYCDMLCTNSDCGAVTGDWWEFDGKRYVRSGDFTYSDHDHPWQAAGIARMANGALAAWDTFPRLFPPLGSDAGR